MRALCIALSVAAALAAHAAFAHGPQIQITNTNGEIVTRRLMNPLSNGHYPTQATQQTSVYVMPLAEYLGVWKAQPNNSKLANGDPEFDGWPGFMYGNGYDSATNPQPFPSGSRFFLGFTDELQAWNSSTTSFGPTAVELEAFRSTGTARTSDIGPYASVPFPGAAGINWAGEGADTHNTVNYRMLGDGSSTTSPLDDGIYLVSLQLTNVLTGNSPVGSDPADPSDTFYFVLHKGVDFATLSSAVDSLGFASGAVQYVPEPAAGMLVLLGVVGCLTGVRARRTREGM